MVGSAAGDALNTLLGGGIDVLVTVQERERVSMEKEQVQALERCFFGAEYIYLHGRRLSSLRGRLLLAGKKGRRQESCRDYHRHVVPEAGAEGRSKDS